MKEELRVVYFFPFLIVNCASRTRASLNWLRLSSFSSLFCVYLRMFSYPFLLLSFVWFSYSFTPNTIQYQNQQKLKSSLNKQIYIYMCVFV